MVLCLKLVSTYLLARQVNVPKIVVFINKVDEFDEDEREEMVELVQMEVQELLENNGFDADDELFVPGSALLQLKATTQISVVVQSVA